MLSLKNSLTSNMVSLDMGETVLFYLEAGATGKS